MQAIILAAGMGKRLGELTKGHTKCMVRVNDETLIARLLHQLDNIDLSRIVIVVGYKGKELQEYLQDSDVKTPISYVNNPIYDKTNNIYSLYMAKDYLEQEDTLLFESDIIMEDGIIERLVDHPYPNLAVVDKFESWMDGTMVEIDDEFRITRFVPKTQFRSTEASRYYKTVNVYKFSKDFSQNMYVPFLEAYCKAMGRNEYYEQVLRVINMVDNSGLHVMPLKGEAWYEIDDIQDLDIAESIFTEQQYEKLSSRYGGYWRYPHMLDYCYLVNPYFPNQRLVDEIQANFQKLMTQYPSGQKVNSLLAAKAFGVKQNYIVLGNGAAELINVLSEQLNGRIGVIRPTFEEYPNRLTNNDVITYEAKAPGFRYTANDLMIYFADKELDVLVLINPDNPSGNYIPYVDCLQLIEWCKSKSISFVLDESFIDFSSEHRTFLDNNLLEMYPNMIVIKSISKSYGVPGFRLGVLATANEVLISGIRSRLSIWNINSFGEYYMQIIGKYESAYKKAMDTFRYERARFVNMLKSIPLLRVLPTEANYVLCEVKEPASAHEFIERLLRENDILIKDCSSKCGKNYIRIAIRNEKDNNELLKALKELVQ